MPKRKRDQQSTYNRADALREAAEYLSTKEKGLYKKQIEALLRAAAKKNQRLGARVNISQF